jgi:FKBP-type peptidyl-prolyl cis-trans isomerase
MSRIKNMKTKIIKLTTVCFLTTAVCLLQGCSTHSQPPKQAAGISSTNLLGDFKSRSSYAVGMTVGESFKQQGIDVNDEVFLCGLKDAQAGTNMLMTEQEMRDTLNQLKQTLYAKQQKMRAELGEKNKAEGEAFLTTNKNNSGVVTLPDGLQYKILTDGNGEIPGPDDTVTVNYRGTFIDGTEFDSSYKHGKPAQFRAGGVIHGWAEALTHMKVGSKWRLFIPAELAYGENGSRAIPPNAALIFEIELLSSEQAKPVVSEPAKPVTSDIIKVPSADEMKKGAKIEVIKPEDAEKLQNQATNTAK